MTFQKFYILEKSNILRDYIVRSIYNTVVNIRTKTQIGHGSVISILYKHENDVLRQFMTGKGSR